MQILTNRRKRTRHKQLRWLLLWMDYRLLSTRLALILKKRVVACLIILTSMVPAVRNYCDDAEGFQLTILIRLLLPGRSLFNKWNMRDWPLLI